MRRPAVIFGILCAVVLAAYWPSFTGFGIFDDVHWIPEILTPVTLAPTWDLAHWSLSVNAAMSGVILETYTRHDVSMFLWPVFFHLTNVGIHCVNGWLVFVLVRRILLRAWVRAQFPAILGLGLLSPDEMIEMTEAKEHMRDRLAVPALIAAAVFLLHPIQTEAVAYLSCRWELVATMLVLIALVGPWWLATVAAVLAMTTKTSAVVVLALLPLVRGMDYDLWLATWPLLVTATLVIAETIWRDIVGKVPYLFQSPYGPIEYAARQAVALWRMLALVVVPWGQTIDHDWIHVPTFVVAGAIPAMLGALVGIARERKAQPILWLAACWILICVAPRFVVRTPEFLHEHNFYLPFVGVALLVGSWSRP